MIGRTLGQFLVLEQIGAGGMGVVYKARDESLDRDVVLKVLPPGALADDKARKRFRAEALALSRLNHPNICTIYQVGEAEGQTYIAMEYVEGRTLDELIRDGLVSMDAVARYGGQIAEALAHAHERGLTHRDMKSANVMITPDGRAKVLDFGLAVPSVAADTDSARTQLTETGAIVGTLAYMSPEVVRGEPADARSDLWGLGVLLYEMAVGSRPFKEAGHALTYAILERSPELPESVPPVLRSIILRCLAKQPGERYQASGEVRAALGAVETQSQTGGFPVPAQRGRRRLRQVLVGAGGVGLLVLLAYGIIRLGPPPIGSVEAQPIRSLAVLPCTSVSADPEEAWFVDGLTHGIIGELGKLPEVNVIQPRTMMTYQDSDMTAAQIGSELNVDAIVECSALISRGQAQLQLSLTTTSGDNFWNEDFELDLSDIPSVVRQTARTVAGEIGAVLTPEAEARFADPGPVDRDAWELTERGKFAARQLSQDSLLSAIEQFDLAIERDDQYAPAHAGKAFAYAQLATFEYLAPHDAMPEVKLAALEAIAIDPDLAEAHAWLGFYYIFYEWDWGLAEEELLKALDLNRSSSDALMAYSAYLLTQGEMVDAIRYAKDARLVDQKSPTVLSSGVGGLQATLYMAEQYDEAIQVGREALALKSDSPEALAWLGITLLESGAVGEGIEALEEANRLDEDAALVKAFLAYAYARAGRESEARRRLSEVEQVWRENYTCAYEIALTYWVLGDEDDVFMWLRRALDDRAACVPYMNVDHRWGSLRTDSRFIALLDEVAFDR